MPFARETDPDTCACFSPPVNLFFYGTYVRVLFMKAGLRRNTSQEKFAQDGRGAPSGPEAHLRPSRRTGDRD